MDCNTARNVRNTLAGNFGTLISMATHLRHNPSKIKIEALDRREVEAITIANFAFQIGAIDGETYCNLRHLVMDVTDSVKEFRSIRSAKNYLCGKSGAIFNARLNIAERVNNLCAALDKMKHGDASTPDTAATTQIILSSGLVSG